MGSCCGGACGGKKDETDHSKKKHSGKCCSEDKGTCSCAGKGKNPLDLSVKQIKKINDILGDIDDEDLETGNYDLTEEQAEELNNILFGKEK